MVLLFEKDTVHFILVIKGGCVDEAQGVKSYGKRDSLGVQRPN